MTDIVTQIEHRLTAFEHTENAEVAECLTVLELAKDEIMAARDRLVVQAVDLERMGADNRTLRGANMVLKEKLLDRQIEQERMAREINEIVANYAKLEQLVDRVRQLSYREPGHA